MKREFLVEVLYPKGGVFFGLVWRIMLLGKRRSINKLDYMALVKNYLKKKRYGVP